MLSLLKETKLDHSLDNGFTFEDSSGISGVEGKELSGSLSDLGENVLGLEDFSLGLETVGSDDLELFVESFFLERSGRLSEVASIYNTKRSVFHV